jgi:hypothetical protein
MRQPPLKIISDSWLRQRALEFREERIRRSNDQLPVHEEHTSCTSSTRRVTIPSRHTGGSKTAGNGTLNDMGMCTRPSSPISAASGWSRTGSW